MNGRGVEEKFFAGARICSFFPLDFLAAAV
jgi:hypothetical protein